MIISIRLPEGFVRFNPDMDDVTKSEDGMITVTTSGNKRTRTFRAPVNLAAFFDDLHRIIDKEGMGVRLGCVADMRHHYTATIDAEVTE